MESEPEKKSVAEIVNMFEKETRSHEEQTIEDVSGSDEQTQKADLVNDEVVIVDTKEEYHISQDSESSDASPVAELPVDVENETVPVHKMVKYLKKYTVNLLLMSCRPKNANKIQNRERN